MNRTGIRHLYSLLIILAASASHGMAQPVVIDDFSVGETALAATDLAGMEQLQQGLHPAAVIGGERFLRTETGLNTGSGVGATVAVDPTAGIVTFETDPNTVGRFNLEYGSLDNPLGIDLNDGLADRVLIEFSELPSDPDDILRATFSVDSTNGSTTIFITDSLQEFSPSGGVVELPFLGFLETTTVGVESIELRFVLGQDATLSVSDIRTAIPEPASLGLVISACGIFLTRRRFA